MAVPLLTTKLNIPPIHADLVPRQRLVRELDSGLRRKLTLISAPAGFGKTTLLSKWVRDRGSELQVAWLSLDSADNDPVRFLNYLVAALQQVDPDLGREALEILGSPRLFRGAESDLLQDVLILLINQIGDLPQDPPQGTGGKPREETGRPGPLSTGEPAARDIILVLDDYHLVETPAIHRAVGFLMEHLPHQLHLVIASRTDPPLPIARLRGQGQVTELRQRDLCFTPGEAGQFLEQALDLELPAGELDALLVRTEGWIAGLQMAAASLRGRQDIPGFIAAFAGSDRFVMDYLIEEVLGRQPPSLQAFLYQTSILDRLTGPLCDAILTESLVTAGVGETVSLQTTLADLPFACCSGQQVLEQLDRANLFLVALDDQRQWYRYHRLFGDLLRQRLQQTRPDLVPRLHRNASKWYQRAGMVDQAIPHALAAGDPARAADLIKQVAETTWMHSKVATFLGWIEGLPGEVLRGRPVLGVYYALALLMGGRPLEDVEARLRQATSPDADLPQNEAGVHSAGVTICRAIMAAYQGRVDESARLATDALELLPSDCLFLRSLVVGVLALAHLYSGDIARATRSLEEAARVSRQAGNMLNSVLALCHLGGLCSLQGQLSAARERYDQALALAVDGSNRRLPVAGVALSGLGWLHLQWNDLAAAERCACEGIQLSTRFGAPGTLKGTSLLARVKAAQGDFSEARRLLQQAAQIAARFDAMEMDDLGVAMDLARLSLLEGNLQEAQRWARQRGLDLTSAPANLGAEDGRKPFLQRYIRDLEQLILARLLIALGRSQDKGHLDRAVAILDQLLLRAESNGYSARVIEVLVLRAVTCQLLGHTAGAERALDRALCLAKAEGYVRVFVDEGEPVAALLQSAFLRGVAPGYARKLLEAMGATPQTRAARPGLPLDGRAGLEQPLVEELSPRELEILRFLTTSLSSTEIAERLYVSVNTARSHIRHIYEKLDVHSRLEAIARAQELSLI